MNKFLTAVIASVLILAASVQADDQQTGKKTHQKEREAAQEAQPAANQQDGRPAASAHGAPRAYVPTSVTPRTPRRIPPASVQQQRRAPHRPDNSGIQKQTDAPAPVVTNEPAPAPPRSHHRDGRVATAPGEKPEAQKIRARHTNFRAQPKPQEVPPVTFDENHRIKGSEHWQGDKYAAFRSYHPHRHDRDWYHKHHHRIVFICGGYYFWDNFYWFPAWGYDPSASYYVYDGPIYSGPLAEPPDQLIADVQAALQELGYYDGEVDGILGPATQDALADYQADSGLYETSAIDQPTLNSLGLG
jgi:Putative peptidoglycan binding domain